MKAGQASRSPIGPPTGLFAWSELGGASPDVTRGRLGFRRLLRIRAAKPGTEQSRSTARSGAPSAMYDPERRWSLSFAGCGFLGFYHIGATLCLSERAPHLLRDARTFFGCSAGALHAVAFLCSLPLGASAATTQAPRAGRGAPPGESVTLSGGPEGTCPDSSQPSGCRGALSAGDPGPVTWRGISEGGRERLRSTTETLEHLIPGALV